MCEKVHFPVSSAQHCTYMCIIYILQEVDERFLLVFSDDFVMLAVGRSLSGYEMKVHLACIYVCIYMYTCINYLV